MKMEYKQVSKEEFHRRLNLGEDKVISCISKDNEALWVGRNSGEPFGRVVICSQDFNEFTHEILCQ